MIIPALEYRRFVQKPRTAKEKEAKLKSIASRTKVSVPEILTSYEKGDDILDPDLFPKEDIIEFAKEEKIENDPLVLAFIQRSRPLVAWA